MFPGEVCPICERLSSSLSSHADRLRREHLGPKKIVKEKKEKEQLLGHWIHWFFFFLYLFYFIFFGPRPTVTERQLLPHPLLLCFFLSRARIKDGKRKKQKRRSDGASGVVFFLTCGPFSAITLPSPWSGRSIKDRPKGPWRC